MPQTTTPTHTTNQQFIDYIKARRDAIEAEIRRNKEQAGIAKEVLSSTAIEGMKMQLEMLTDALRIMTHGTGPARRRFRRDYERNLARQGVKLEG